MLRLLAGPLSVLTLLLSCFQVFSQTPVQYLDQAKAIQNDPKVKAAFDYIDKNRESILREWIAITEINAPSGHEQERAKYIEEAAAQAQAAEHSLRRGGQPYCRAQGNWWRTSGRL